MNLQHRNALVFSVGPRFTHTPSYAPASSFISAMIRSASASALAMLSLSAWQLGQGNCLVPSMVPLLKAAIHGRPYFHFTRRAL